MLSTGGEPQLLGRLGMELRQRLRHALGIDELGGALRAIDAHAVRVLRVGGVDAGDGVVVSRHRRSLRRLGHRQTLAGIIARQHRGAEASATRRTVLDGNASPPICGLMAETLRPMPIPIVPLVVATALFMETMDSTILATALPTIARDLGIDVIALKLAVTAYLVSLAVFIPVSGWVADRLGVRATFRAALAIFLCASIGCAFSRSLETFAIWRFVQGFGGAMMVPVGRLVILRAVPKAGLVRALAFLPCPRSSGPCSGLRSAASSSPMPTGWIFFVASIGLLGIVRRSTT
jgi:hypothetical protein